MTPKEYLSRYREIDREIDGKINQLEQLREKAMRITTEPAEDGIPGAVSSAGDRLGDVVAKIVDLETEINVAVDRLVDTKREILGTISRINDPTLRNLLELRYINGCTFEQIAERMPYSWRQVIRLHGLALLKVKDVIACHI